jgi:hypothetical protein
MSIVEYKVITSQARGIFNPAKTGESLSQFVNEAIKDGWVPLGGVTLYNNLLFQAMVKYA